MCVCKSFVAVRVRKDQASLKPEKGRNKVPKSDIDDESEAEGEETTEEEEVQLEVIQATQGELYTYT